jgi:CRISPR-associated protein Cas1
MATRHACRDAFRRTNILARLIPAIEEVLLAGEIALPQPPADAVGPAFSAPESAADPGVRP